MVIAKGLTERLACDLSDGKLKHLGKFHPSTASHLHAHNPVMAPSLRLAYLLSLLFLCTLSSTYAPAEYKYVIS